MTHSLRRIACAAVAGATGAAMLATGTPASADTVHYLWNSAKSARVDFHQTGDIFVLHDLAADGHPTYFQWRYPNGDWHPKHWNYNGYAGAPETYNFDFDENTHPYIFVKVCTEVNNWPDDCAESGAWHT
ncbi:hypothetical protein [Fodinicola acaciae]|uniref:hypothetical protein n=1 Tax=Fodinicola acaciae TaxID=2681555 RepID=UPI0013D8BEA1|nr:hypothetical protein [Fodinicola acaciae]